jgi:hypothetical protein
LQRDEKIERGRKGKNCESKIWRKYVRGEKGKGMASNENGGKRKEGRGLDRVRRRLIE